MLEEWIRLADGEGCVVYGQRPDPTYSLTDVTHYNAAGQHRYTH